MNNALFQIYTDRLEEYLAHVVNSKVIPCHRLKAAIEYSLLNGGKRFRPLLVYLTGEILNIELEILDVIAAGVEMVHCYSLIHDDLPAMDDDDFRRGMPSCHKAFDQATAILAGDALSSWSLELLISELSKNINPSIILKLCQRLLKAIGVEGMISGQSLDLTVLSSNASEQELEWIHSLKTGYLIDSCIMMVTDLIDVDEYKLYAFKQFSYNLGIVFQMQDDYLDRYSPDVGLGKMRSSDIANDKTTYAQLFDKNTLKNKIDILFASCYEILQVINKDKNGLVALVSWLQSRTQ